MKKILGSMRKAIENYDMIKPNETITVGVSGGKDSMALLTALSRYRHFSPVPFNLNAVTVDLGFEGTDYSPVAKYCKKIDVDYFIEPTDIGKIVFDIRNEKSPCSLCAKLKRGALHTAALKHGSRTVALGHHSDDAVETFFMSLFYEGRINCFSPVTYLDRRNITVIRPLIYVKEKDIKFSEELKNVPIVKSLCPVDGKTKREDMKNFIRELKKKYPDADQRVLKAIENKNQFNLWFDENGLKTRTI